MASFTGGGLSISGGHGDSGFFLETIKDWYSTPDSKSEIVERQTLHGAFGTGPDIRKSVAFSVKGWFRGETAGSALAATETLRRAFGTNQPLLVAFDDDFRETSRTVSVRQIDIPDLHGLPSFKFTIDMVAPDFRRYGAEVVTSTGLPTSGGGLDYPIKYPIEYGVPGDSGRLTVTNLGTENTFPVLEVSGGMSGGFELTDVRTGRVLQFVRAVPLGATVIINMRTKQVFQDDVANNVSRWLTRREWWSQPASVTSEIQFNSLGTVTGTPILTARVASAY